jgi:hypothetical protein
MKEECKAGECKAGDLRCINCNCLVSDHEAAKKKPTKLNGVVDGVVMQ